MQFWGSSCHGRPRIPESLMGTFTYNLWLQAKTKASGSYIVSVMWTPCLLRLGILCRYLNECPLKTNIHNIIHHQMFACKMKTPFLGNILTLTTYSIPLSIACVRWAHSTAEVISCVDIQRSMSSWLWQRNHRKESNVLPAIITMHFFTFTFTGIKEPVLLLYCMHPQRKKTTETTTQLASSSDLVVHGPIQKCDGFSYPYWLIDFSNIPMFRYTHE